MAREDDPDDSEYDEDDELEDDEDEGPEVGVRIEIVGLSLYTHVGITPAEREVGQRLLFDVAFDVGEVDAIGHGRVAVLQLEGDVEQQPLPDLALRLLDAVVRVERQADDLDADRRLAQLVVGVLFGL